MNKVYDLPASVVRAGRYDIAFIDGAAAQHTPNFDEDPFTTVSVKQGYYKPSKNPGYWVFVGDYVSDPYKVYERRLKKYNHEMAKLLRDGIYANTVLPEKPEFPRRKK